MDITLKIKTLLVEKKLTQEEFGNKIGKTKQTINNYFTGRTKLDVETLVKIAEILEVPVSYFFGESGGNNTINSNGKYNINAQGKNINQQLNESNQNIKELEMEKEMLARENKSLKREIATLREMIEMLKNLNK